MRHDIDTRMLGAEATVRRMGCSGDCRQGRDCDCGEAEDLESHPMYVRGYRDGWGWGATCGAFALVIVCLLSFAAHSAIF